MSLLFLSAGPPPAYSRLLHNDRISKHKAATNSLIKIAHRQTLCFNEHVYGREKMERIIEIRALKL